MRNSGYNRFQGRNPRKSVGYADSNDLEDHQSTQDRSERSSYFNPRQTYQNGLELEPNIDDEIENNKIRLTAIHQNKDDGGGCAC